MISLVHIIDITYTTVYDTFLRALNAVDKSEDLFEYGMCVYMYMMYILYIYIIYTCAHFIITQI